MINMNKRYEENKSKYFIKLSIKQITLKTTTHLEYLVVFVHVCALYFNDCWYFNVIQIYTDECQFLFHVCMIIRAIRRLEKLRFRMN